MKKQYTVKKSVRNLTQAVSNTLSAVSTAAVVSTEVVADVTGAAAGAVEHVIPTTKQVGSALVGLGLGMANSEKSVEEVAALQQELSLRKLVDTLPEAAIAVGQSMAQAWDDEEDEEEETIVLTKSQAKALKLKDLKEWANS